MQRVQSPSAMRYMASASALGTAACSALAAYYWYLSSRHNAVLTDPPLASISDNPEEHVLTVQVNASALQAALSESSRLNKIAATWSALAAAFATIAAILAAL